MRLQQIEAAGIRLHIMEEWALGTWQAILDRPEIAGAAIAGHDFGARPQQVSPDRGNVAPLTFLSEIAAVAQHRHGA